ncbi:MAG: hypothetical protein Q8R18_01950 [bacterium]|nr:hypothetical protein [bacterium]
MKKVVIGIGVLYLFFISLAFYLHLIPLFLVTSVNDTDIVIRDDDTGLSKAFGLWYSENEEEGITYYKSNSPFETDGKIVIQKGDFVNLYGLVLSVDEVTDQTVYISGNKENPLEKILAMVHPLEEGAIQFNKRGTYYLYIPANTENILFYSEISQEYLSYIEAEVIVK